MIEILALAAGHVPAAMGVWNISKFEPISLITLIKEATGGRLTKIYVG